MTETAADLTPRPIDTGLEEVETTRAERFLAVVLGVFVFIGLLWAYFQPLDLHDADARFFAARGHPVTAIDPSRA